MVKSNWRVVFFCTVPNTMLEGVIEIEEVGVLPDRGIVNNVVSELFRKNSVSEKTPNLTGLNRTVIVAVSLFVA
jgi:hypothetical protein